MEVKQMNSKRNSTILPGLIDKEFYDKIKMNETLMLCDICHHEWRTKDTNIFEAEYEDSDKDKYFVIAFRCGKCGKEYLIAVNNGTTATELRELRRIEKSMSNLITKQKGKPTPQLVKDYNHLVDKHKKLTVRIKKHQDTLKNMYNERILELTLVNTTENK